ncbi:MAG: hypothetical protein U1E20_13120 [Methylocystis sp.]|uniref:hypothetical protein n=1 Tax=Methylocystis sp. TaxID=1911079 RepID=UPI003922FC48
MYMTPIDFLDFGLRTFMRNPFFNPERISLQQGESDFRLLDAREGLVVTLGPDTSFFDRPSRSVCRWPGTRTIPRQSPHSAQKRSWIAHEFATFLYVCFGGGDVKLNRIAASRKQSEILLTAGEGNVIEKIDLTKLARDNSPPLLFLQPAYLCSSANVAIRSVPCDASTMSWARAPYVYQTRAIDDLSTPAILCLTGKTLIWCERIEPGESRDYALGNVIAATANIASKLRPTSQEHPEDRRAAAVQLSHSSANEIVLASTKTSRDNFRLRLREIAAATKILFESIRAREGFFVCEMSNDSEAPAHVFVQLNKSDFYGGSGLIGFAIKFLSSIFRLSHLSLGH